MHRPVSPIWHDYKPAPAKYRPPQRRLPWFVAGLGLPLVTVSLLLGLRDASGNQTAVATVVTPSQLSSATQTPIDAAVSDAATTEIPEPGELLDPAATTTPGAPAPETVLPAPETPTHASLELVVAAGDTLERLFRRHDLSLSDLAAIVRLPEAKDELRLLRPGDRLEVEHEAGAVRRLYKDIDYSTALVVTAGAEKGFDAELAPRPMEIREALAHGTIETSLFEAALDSGLSDKVIMNLAGIFAWDVDFVLDIRKGDSFLILYEEIWQDGRHVADGDIVAAEFDNDGRSFRAVRYLDADGRSDYYTPEGLSVRKAFVRAPVDFTRISSNFNPRRRHPILNTIRAHRGVDYAAPSGTPVKAAGDGKVIFRGRKGGYGNVVILQHGGNITTLYAHLSKFARKSGVGARVKQGQVIGYVGRTGLATAAHLHYEYRVNGVHRNPRTVELPAADPIRQQYREDFLVVSAPYLEQLDRYKQTRLAALD